MATQYAQEFSRALGRTIHYINVPPQIWEAKLHEAQLPAHLRNLAFQQPPNVYNDFRNG